MRMRFIGLTLAVALLLSGCLSVHQPLGLPDISVLSYDGTRVVPPDCNALSAPSTLLDAGEQRPSVAFGCATYSNLAAMIARPADVGTPQPLAPPSATTGAAAVRRYFERTITLPSTTTNYQSQ